MKQDSEKGSALVIVIVLLAILTVMVSANKDRLLQLRDQLKIIETKHNK